MTQTKHVKPNGSQHVSGTELSRWLDCSRPFIHELAAQGTIERTARGFLLQPSIVGYVRVLRRQRRHSSPQADAVAEYQRARSEWFKIRLLERQKVLMPVEEFHAAIDTMAGDVLTALAGLPARLFAKDLGERKR